MFFKLLVQFCSSKKRLLWTSGGAELPTAQVTAVPRFGDILIMVQSFGWTDELDSASLRARNGVMCTNQRLLVNKCVYLLKTLQNVENEAAWIAQQTDKETRGEQRLRDLHVGFENKRTLSRFALQKRSMET